MFSYQNKIIGISASLTDDSDHFDVLVNNALIGSAISSGTTLFVASQNTEINTATATGFPSTIGIKYYIDDNFNEEFEPNEVIANFQAERQLSGSGAFYDLSAEFGEGSYISNSGTGDNWQVFVFGEEHFPQTVSQNPSRPYGSYDDQNSGGYYYYEEIYRVEIYPIDGIYPSDERYYFSDLLLNEGQNELCFSNSLNRGIAGGNQIRYDIQSYDLSGSTLINPSSIDFETIYLSTGSSQCVFFDLAFPTENSIPLVEIFPVFNVDTGDLNQVFLGSGVHLKKDVTFFFDILDQQLNTVSSNQQFLENPLISGCIFDILNVDGTVAAENFSTGKSARSVTVSALDNEDIFGSYQKDFGVRCKLPNTFDGSIFTGEFYAFGNLPNILDIVPDFTEFSGEAKVTELLNAAIVLQNDLNFTQMDRYDVYASTESGSAVDELTFLNPFEREGYLFSQSATDVTSARSLTINRGALTQNEPHFFTVVPYGSLGSGNSFVFGPAVFAASENIVEFSEVNASAINLYHGDPFSQSVYRTGVFFSDTGILHEFSSGQFSSVKYFIEISGDGQRQLSELRGVINTTGLDLTKQPVNDTLTQYQLTGFASGRCGLFASGSGYANHTYKLQATMI